MAAGQRKYRRAIVVEYVLSDTPGPGVTEYADLSETSDQHVIGDELATPHPKWFETTGYAVVSDAIVRVPLVNPLEPGCSGG
jgi:hypothetical protein